jgi:GDPmannose 4,6-dehydratase
MMLQHETPGDYVVATGKTYSVHDFVLTALEVAGLDKDVEKYVDFDKEMIRPSEVELLVGDSSKIQRELGWRSKTSFQGLVELMVENDLKIESTR